MRFLLAVCLAACTAHAAELAQLANGFSIRCERHEVLGETTRLHMANGFTDLPTASIARFEPAPPEPVPTAAAPKASVGVPVGEHIHRAGLATGIDPDFLHSVVKAESGYNAKAVSPKGAQGLMQLMPGTAARLGVPDSLDPAANIDGGSRYLRELLARYNGDAHKALAAYNAGPGRVEQYRGVPPYSETRAYVARVINEFNRRKLAASAQSAPAKHKSRPKPVSASAKAAASRSTAANDSLRQLAHTTAKDRLAHAAAFAGTTPATLPTNRSSLGTPATTPTNRSSLGTPADSGHQNR